MTLPRLTTVGYDVTALTQNFTEAMLTAITGPDVAVPPPADIRLRLIPGETS